MRGSVIKRGTSWSYVVYLGRDAAGTKRQKWKGGFATKRAAEDALTETLERIRTGNFVDAGRKTVGEFLEEWFVAAAGSLRPSTASSYEHVIRSWVIPRIGAVRLSQLGRMHVTQLHEALLTAGRSDGRGGLSSGSVHYAHRVLSRALADAVRWGLVPRNVATLVSPPRLVTPEMKVWSAADARRFLEGVADDRLYAMWLLFVMTGMRRGEVLGLRWQDVDLEAGRLAIRQTLVEVGYKGPLLRAEDEAFAPLGEHRRHHLFRPRQSSRASRSRAPADHRHRRPRVHAARRSPAPAPERLAVVPEHHPPARPPPIRLHDLRHTSATLALAAGIHPKVVSERLGHSSIAITLDTYSHVVPGLQEAAATTLASLVLGDG